VPAPPLFDISGIDLNSVAATAEQIEAVNPHRGAMRLLDRVVWMNDDVTCGIGVKNVRNDEFWVPGHVPGRPLLPGVLMIEAAAQLCSYLELIKAGHDAPPFLGFVRCDDVAFRGQVVPGDTLLLLAQQLSHRRRRFESRTQGWVEDRLVFEGTITGMAI
jgi:3-hydroxyacyl-[acyl-carrier-protein] dehydratase